MILYVPIFIDGKWVLGISEDDVPRQMTEEEIEDCCDLLNYEEMEEKK